MTAAHERSGRMQLVPTDVHSETAHSGSISLSNKIGINENVKRAELR